MSDFLTEVRKELAEAHTDLHLFESLMEHKGWMRLVSIMEKRIRSTEIELCYGNDDLTVAAAEHTKGILQGLLMITQLPDMIKGAAEDSIETSEERLDELEDKETAEGS